MAKTRSSRKQSTKKNRLYKGGVPPKTKPSVSRTQSPDNKMEPYRHITESYIPLSSVYNERIQGPIGKPGILSKTTRRSKRLREKAPKSSPGSPRKSVSRSSSRTSSPKTRKSPPLTDVSLD